MMRHYAQFIALAVALAFPCSSYAQEPIAITPGIGLPGIVLLGQSRDSVELVLGKSDEYRCTSTRTSIKENKRSTSKTVIKAWVGVQRYRSFYESKQIYVNYSVKHKRQHVRSIEVMGAGYITDKGLSVGSTTEQVIAAYGPLLNGQADYRQRGLTFTIEDGKVETIVLSVPE